MTMMPKYRIAMSVAALSLLPVLTHAASPAVSMQQALGSVQCPERVEGVHLERIRDFDVPSGWQDDPYPGGGYSGVSLLVNKHYLTNNGKTMVCGYGARSGNAAYTLIQIAKAVPGNKQCSKGANYSFNCKLKAPRLRR
jgi:hypothetical protein